MSEERLAAIRRMRFTEPTFGPYTTIPAALGDLILRIREQHHATQELLAEVNRLQGRTADGYLPALPWARQLDADDLEGLLADLADAASGGDDLTTLAEVERVIATWRAIAEADQAMRTAPGPGDACEQPPMDETRRRTDALADDLRRLLNTHGVHGLDRQYGVVSVAAIIKDLADWDALVRELQIPASEIKSVGYACVGVVERDGVELRLVGHGVPALLNAKLAGVEQS